jgi:SAM-dependent methyltransferase
LAAVLGRLTREIGRRVGRVSTLGLDTGPHVTRYYMYRRLQQFRVPTSADDKVLSISGSEELCRCIGYSASQVVRADYPQESILDLSFPDAMFDCLVADQVLEHVTGDPRRAIEESFRVVKPGGLVLHTTCFIQPIHRHPVDFWRFSPEALSYLVGDQGTIVDVGGWGNLLVWPLVFLGMRFQPIPHARWHPLRWIATMNSENWPIVTWVLARKT